MNDKISNDPFPGSSAVLVRYPLPGTDDQDRSSTSQSGNAAGRGFRAR